jgi:hypothetical protein
MQTFENHSTCYFFIDAMKEGITLRQFLPSPLPRAFLVSFKNKVHLYKEYHMQRMSPRWNWDSLPPPLSPASVPLPPEPKGPGQTRLRVRGWGSPNSNDWRKSLALCLLCGLLIF